MASSSWELRLPQQGRVGGTGQNGRENTGHPRRVRLGPFLGQGMR